MKYYRDGRDGKLLYEFGEALTGIKRRARGEGSGMGGRVGEVVVGNWRRRWWRRHEEEPSKSKQPKSEYQERVDTTSCTNRVHSPCFQGRARDAVTQREGSCDVYPKEKVGKKGIMESEI